MAAQSKLQPAAGRSPAALPHANMDFNSLACKQTPLGCSSSLLSGGGAMNEVSSSIYVDSLPAAHLWPNKEQEVESSSAPDKRGLLLKK